MKRRIFGLLVLLGVAQTFGTRGFPDSLNIGLAQPINDVQRWVRGNRNSHWIFQYVMNPFISAVEFGIESVESLIGWLPWYILAILAFAVVARTRRYGLAAFTALAVLYPGFVGIWSESIVTISLMTVAVFICVLIGVPLGIIAALNQRVESILRPILDGMQTVPATVYLIPIVLFFGIGPAPAAVATVIYALPPLVRLTTAGIQQVPKSAVEASQMFGATKRQVLTKVQLPLAVPSIVAGINQTIMMALGIVVIATLVGAGGLGQEINQTVRRLEPGRGLVVSLAVVAVALVLDRVSMSLVPTPGKDRLQLRGKTRNLALIALGVSVITGRMFNWVKFPFSWGTSFADPIDTGFKWFRTTFNVVTRPFNDFIVREILVRSQVLFNETITWQAVIVIAAATSFVIAGWKMSVFTAIGIALIGFTGRWLDAVDTLAQTVVAVFISMLIALPIGVWIERHPRIEAVIAPILDAFQTIPNLVYAIPFVMIFSVGPVPGIVAAVVYAIPPGIRLTALGIRQVNTETIEAATTFGATDRQVLWGVRIPLAMPSIILAINQMVMMVLAMAIIAGMVGGGGLGYRSIEALTGPDSGLGVEVGLAIVIMATILDRLLQALARRLDPRTSLQTV